MMARFFVFLTFASVIGYATWDWYKTRDLDVIFITHVKDGENAGDRNQMLGVIEDLKKHKKINAFECDINDLDSAVTRIKQGKKKAIVLAVAAYGVDALVKIHSLVAKKYVGVHLSHQLLVEQQKLFTDGRKVDVMVLPEHVIQNDLPRQLQKSGVTLIQTVGVAHNIRTKDVESEYELGKNALPSARCYVGIMLGGDATLTGGAKQYFSQEDACTLAKHVVPLSRVKQCHMLITNGPRTGLYDPKTGEKTNAHSDKTLDSVTQAFVEAVEKEGCVVNRDFAIFPYINGKPSAYKTILGAVNHSDESIFLVPGDSTSMVSEVISYLKNIKIYAYRNSAMNESHHSHIDRERHRGALLELGDNPTSEHAKITIKRATEEIASGLILIMQGRQR